MRWDISGMLPDLNTLGGPCQGAKMIPAIVRTLAVLFFIGQAALAAPPADRPATKKEYTRVTEALEKLGYTNIHDIEVDDGRFEADATTRPGYDVELELDMKSLKVLHEHRD
jgi:Peptidase propeptide and YPEB domain